MADRDKQKINYFEYQSGSSKMAASDEQRIDDFENQSGSSKMAASDEQKIDDFEYQASSSIGLQQQPDCEFEAYFSSMNEFPDGSSVCNHPSVCLNSKGAAVLFYSRLMRLYYRVGRYHDGQNTLTWGAKTFFQVGYSPKATLNDTNVLVVVQNHVIRRLCAFKVGVVDAGNLKIDWIMESHDHLANGIDPSVALISAPGSDLRLLFVYHSSSYLKYDCLYSVAKMDDRKHVTFVGSKHRRLPELDDSTKISVAADKDGTFVLTFENTRSHCLSYVIGKFENDGVVISELRRFTIGYRPQVCLVGNGKAVETHEVALGSSIVFKYGCLRDNRIYWEKGQKFESGYAPSVACSGNRIVEVHVTLLGTLQFRVGYLNDL